MTPVQSHNKACRFVTSRWIKGNYAQPCGNTDLTGYGAHVVVYGAGLGYVEGVELYRVGQTNVLGKYPMHFHLLGECPSCYFRESSVHRSYYRCISVHGTNSSLVTENVAYDITGFCYYLEDGVEANNTISFNLAALVHNIGPENPWGAVQTTNVYQQNATLTNPADVTASGFYISNVHNNLIGNAASGGWAGFAFPVLPTALASFRTLGYQPSSATVLIFDGNTAHSTGWWWNHAGAFYFGGALYYNSGGVLEYNPGRDQGHNRGSRIHMTNAKAFLASSVGLNSWSGSIEISGYEAHDVALTMEALSSGFWLDNALSVCRTGEALAMPAGCSAKYVAGHGFFWYDTAQSHIITNVEFRNCGYRSSQYNQYDNSTTRGCGDSDSYGCDSGSTTFGLLSHSDQYVPQIMQGTRAIAFNNCGRRFAMTVVSHVTVAGRSQNWLDVDGSITGFHVPSLIGSGFDEVKGWWHVDDDAVYDPQGPLRFIKQTNGPQRGLAHFRMTWDALANSQVGGSVCSNGNYAIPCPTLGYVRHRGVKFSPAISGTTPGMPVNAGGNIVGPVGGFGWILNMTAGAPKSIQFQEIEVRLETPLLISIPYPKGTSFAIIAHAASWCWLDAAHSCQENFTAVTSINQVRNGAGNTYYVDSNGVLSFRIIETAIDFVGRPAWFLPSLNDTGRDGKTPVIQRFERGGVFLPQVEWGPYLTLQADCPTSDGIYCSQLPPSYDPDICPAGYLQTAYDGCCTSSGSTCVYADGSSN